MNKYVIISIDETGRFGNFQSSILVKVNPVEVVDCGFRDMGRYVSSEYDETLWLLFKKNIITNNLYQLKNYAKAGESGVFLDLDIDNWFDEEVIIVNDRGNEHRQKIFVSRDHDEYFDEMEYYYQRHELKGYAEFEEEQYIAQQRRLRAAGKMYDDYIDSFDEDNEWDY